MKITVINGTAKKGVTYHLKEIFLDEFRGKAEITEFYLPKDGPGFCSGSGVKYRHSPAAFCPDPQASHVTTYRLW